MTKLPPSKRKKEPAPADVLDRAADVLEERGWTRGTLEKDDGCLCAMGAINLAYYGYAREPSRPPAIRPAIMHAIIALADEVNLYRLNNARFAVMDWNDNDAKNKRQVVATMRRVARKLRVAA